MLHCLAPSHTSTAHGSSAFFHKPPPDYTSFHFQSPRVPSCTKEFHRRLPLWATRPCDQCRHAARSGRATSPITPHQPHNQDTWTLEIDPGSGGGLAVRPLGHPRPFLSGNNGGVCRRFTASYGTSLRPLATDAGRLRAIDTRLLSKSLGVWKLSPVVHTTLFQKWTSEHRRSVSVLT